MHEESENTNRPKPFYVDEKHAIRLYQGDALELLEQAKSETFDLIFAIRHIFYQTTE